MSRWIGLPIKTKWPVHSRKYVKLLTDLTYIDDEGVKWHVPAPYLTDGASIPGIFWSIVGQPLSPETIECAIIHDYYCEMKTRPSKRVHEVFCESLKSMRVPLWKRTLMCRAVKWFGPKWKV
jgi:hypothetical protein